MKLAEALLLRSEYQQKIENLQSRILSNIKAQEGDQPHENPEMLLEEVFRLHEALCDLIKKINHRNNCTKLENGWTLSEALCDRDMLMKKCNFLSSIANKANEKDFRLTHTEVRMTVTMSIAKVQKDMDDLSRQFRELDTQIQGINWTVEL